MPKKLTVDQNGVVILVEDVPERDFPLPQPKPGTGRKRRARYQGGFKGVRPILLMDDLCGKKARNPLLSS